jgi:hypothetical protein
LLGDVTELEPDFDFFRIATPYARAFLGLERFSGIEQIAQHVLSQIVSTSTALLKMPERVEQVLGRLQAGELQIKVDTELRGPLSRIRRRSDSDTSNTASVPGFTWPILFAVSLAGGIVLLDTSQHVVEAWVCLLLAALIAVRGWIAR